MDILNDEELLLEVAEGSDRALAEFYGRHHAKVRAFALKKGRTQEFADELCQIVFIQLFRKKNLYDPQYKALAWLYVITKSEHKDLLLKEKRHQNPDLLTELSQSQASPPSKVESEVDIDEVLATLSPQEQELVRARYLNEEEYAAIAERLQSSEASVRQMVSRAIKKLRLKLERRTS